MDHCDKAFNNNCRHLPRMALAVSMVDTLSEGTRDHTAQVQTIRSSLLDQALQDVQRRSLPPRRIAYP